MIPTITIRKVESFGDLISSNPYSGYTLTLDPTTEPTDAAPDCDHDRNWGFIFFTV
jgi:hypothetical protein